MSNEELARELAQEYRKRKYAWTFADAKRIPNQDEIVEALRWLKSNTPEDHFQVSGRLVAVNSDGHFDIYLHVGELE